MMKLDNNLFSGFIKQNENLKYDYQTHSKRINKSIYKSYFKTIEHYAKKLSQKKNVEIVLAFII